MKLPEPIIAKELADKIGATCIGNEELLITGLNEIHRVEQGDVTFCDHPKYLERTLNSEATAIITNVEQDVPNDKVLLIVDDPFRAFTELSRTLRGDIHATAMIDETAQVGAGSTIMPGVFLGKSVRVGKDCLIHPNVTVYDGCTIGDRVTIHANTVIGSDAFYYQKRDAYQKLHSSGTVRIENDVEIGAGCTIDRGVTSATVIGTGSKLDNQIQVGHDTVIGRNCLFASQVGIAGVVTIEDEVILWGQVGVQKDLTIGKGAVVLGQSGLAKSLKGGITYFGSPVREAREKMKELALIKQLPSIVRELRSK